MYKDIEELYKKKSSYNIIKKSTFLTYTLFVFISLIFNFFNLNILTILVFLTMIFILKSKIERILGVKLCFSLYKNREDLLPLAKIISESEKKLFKEYFISKKLYNEKSLLFIIEHYRNMAKNIITGGNLLAILSIAIPSVLAFYTQDGFDFNGMINSLPYIISFIILIIILYIFYSQFIEIKKFLKGEDGMNERLEEIFSELYIECINLNNLSNKKHSNKQIERKKRMLK